MNSNRNKIFRPAHRHNRLNEGTGGRQGGKGVNAYSTLGALGCCLNSCPTIIQPVCPSSSLYDSLYDKDSYDEHDLAQESIERYSQRRENDRKRRRREQEEKKKKMRCFLVYQDQIF